MPNAESEFSLGENFCSDFSKEKDNRFEIAAHSFIDSTHI